MLTYIILLVVVQAHTKPEVQTVRVFSYIGIGICVLYTCLILVMRERIGLAIGMFCNFTFHALFVIFAAKQLVSSYTHCFS